MIRRHPALTLLLFAAVAGSLGLTGCIRMQTRPDGTPADPDQVEQAEEPPVLTIDDVYQSIALSVQAGDPEAAIAAYEQAEVERPDDPGTSVLLANLYLIGGALTEAQQVLDLVLAGDPMNTEALYLSSLLAAAIDDRDRQRSILENILEIEPDNVQALAAIGELQLQNRELAVAAGSFSAALEADEANLVARMGLANVYLREEEYEAAEAELSTVIENDPDYSFSYSDRARARALQRKFGGAIEDLSAAIEIDPDYPWHYIDRGRVYVEQRRFADAERDFARALELDDTQFITHILRGQARDALGDEAAALADYEAGIVLRPDYTPAYLPIGTLYYLSERFTDAALFFRAAFESDPRRYEYVLLTALAYKSAGEDDQAETWLNSQINEIPRDNLTYRLARYYLMPVNDGYVLNEIRGEPNNTLAGQMYFYLGAQLELIDRQATAQAVLLEAEEMIPQGVLEGRLATRHLDAYRSGSR